jgi:ABC-type Mn2+/Zn2+ transport system permease subunit
VTAIVGAGVLGAMWLLRRPLIFWAFDEAAAPAFGVSSVRMRLTMMVLLALAVVTAMKVVGVVLPTAMLVLPGATALSLPGRGGRSLSRTIALSWLIALAALASGFVASIELNLPTGASIVLALTVIFAAVRVARFGR